MGVLVIGENVYCVWFVVGVEVIDQGCVGGVQVQYVDLYVVLVKVQDYFVQCCDGGDVLQVGVVQVDEYMFQCFFQVEGGDEFVG